MRLALVTYSALPALSSDDQRLLAPLAARGIRAEAASWDDPAVAWDSYEALVVRSTWNYHTALDEFLEWIDRVESLAVRLWNPPPLLRWNAEKTYLRDLATRGVEIAPTRWVAEGGNGSTLAALLADAGWPEAVVKPAVSASAYETWRVDARRLTGADESRFRSLAARRGGVMVQRFVPELARDGEWSLMFMAGELSHAVIKRPRPGDFRVQYEHGGSAGPQTPPPHILSAARAVAARIPGRWLYARVDGVEVGGRFVLIELELLEPSMFLGADPHAAERFATAIARTAGAGR